MTVHEYLALGASASSYLEVGCREGHSLRAVVAANVETLTSVTICDTWESHYGGTGRGSHAHIDELLRSIGYIGQSRFLDGRSSEMLPLLMDERFDLILIDGDHSDAVAESDLRHAARLLAPGGRIVFDDICHPAHLSLRGVAERFAASTGMAAEYFVDDNGFAVFA